MSEIKVLEGGASQVEQQLQNWRSGGWTLSILGYTTQNISGAIKHCLIVQRTQ